MQPRTSSRADRVQVLEKPVCRKLHGLVCRHSAARATRSGAERRGAAATYGLRLPGVLHHVALPEPQNGDTPGRGACGTRASPGPGLDQRVTTYAVAFTRPW